MSRLLRFDGAARSEAQIDRWIEARRPDLAALAREWFAELRACGSDVTELLHDGHPTACIGDAAFAYVNAFTSHVNVGFFRGASLADPAGLLEGTGRFMRHVKLRPGRDVDTAALKDLVQAAYADMQRRLRAEQGRRGPSRRVSQHA